MDPNILSPLKQIRYADHEFVFERATATCFVLEPEKGDKVEKTDDGWRITYATSGKEIDVFKETVVMYARGTRTIDDRPIDYSALLKVGKGKPN